jgi:hypothetical protein
VPHAGRNLSAHRHHAQHDDHPAGRHPAPLGLIATSCAKPHKGSDGFVVTRASA